MAFYLSPGVNVVERDLTNIIPAVSTSTGAFAGVFQWGPVLDPITINSENVLVQRFGKPNDSTFQSFYTAANFLSYSNNLIVSRAAVAGAKNAVVNTTGALVSATVSNPGTGFTNIPVVTVSSGTGVATATLKVVSATVSSGQGGADYALNDVFTVNIGSGSEATFRVTTVNAGAVTGIEIVSAGNYNNIAAVSLANVATLTDDGGSGLQVDLVLGLNTVTVSGGNYTVAPTLDANGSNGGSGSSITGVTIASTGVTINNATAYLDSVYDTGGGTAGEWIAKYPGTLGNSIGVSIADADTYDEDWEVTLPNGNVISFFGEFDSAPGTSSYVSSANGSNDELHVVVYDTLGTWTGIPGTILEKYAFVSKASDAKKSDGANNYYKNAINSASQYVWWADHDAEGTNWGTPAEDKDFDTLTTAKDYQLTGGVDAFNASDAELIAAFDLFANDELYDISLIPVGKASDTVAEYVINNVAEVRKDCVAFVSPQNVSTGEVIIGSGNDAVNALNAYRNNLPSSSYAFLDSGYKYQYDRYNDKYRWVPLNGDIAGLCARTDNTNDPWWSPGGLNRGQIKSVVRLAVNPTKTDRDNLYKNGVNPVVSFPGQGVVLFGDKTLLARPSAFDRINVRRLFIVLEKAIATAAKFQLFEFNDAFTRAQFKALVEPFLRDVQGRRGVVDFRVKCDETNNTGEVIDRNEFVADIFIKPNRSINFITLNFIAARSAVSFEEIGA
jgi:phage tail sheath protein FI